MTTLLRWLARLLGTRTDAVSGAPWQELTKTCPVTGCCGTMHFHKALTEASAPHTLEWDWQPTWVCSHDPAHFEIASYAEYTQLLRERRVTPRR